MNYRLKSNVIRCETLVLSNQRAENSPYNQGFKFKMTVTSALDGFKMVTTTANGIKEVNVFKGNDAETHIEQLNYILKDLMDHNIIVEE